MEIGQPIKRFTAVPPPGEPVIAPEPAAKPVPARREKEREREPA